VQPLRREIGGRPQDAAGHGDLRHLGGRGDAEVRELGHAVLAQQDVARLDVAVQDPLVVRVVEPRGDVAQDPRGGRAVGPALAQQRGERAARDVLHEDHHVGALDHGVEDRDEVRVAQARADTRLAPEALQRVLGALRVQALDRHGPAQPLVLGEQHSAHPPAPDGPQDPVAVAETLRIRGHRPDAAPNGRGSDRPR
jgi:hypothetical protein